jgi:hypothetical protein
VRGVSTDTLTLVIVGVAVVIAVLFLRAMRQVDRETAAAEAALEAAGIADPSLVQTLHDAQLEPVRGKRPWLVWHGEYLVHLALLLIATLFILDTMDYVRRAASFPRTLSIGVVVLTLYEVGFMLTGRKHSGNIMDLGLVSAGTEGSRRAAARVAGAMGAFLLVGVTLHLAYAAIFLSAVIPLLMLRGPGRFPIAVLTGGIVSLFVLIVLDNILFVIWPDPFVTGWDLPWGWILPFTIL